MMLSAMRPYASANSEKFGVDILEYAAALIEQYMPKYPLDGFAAG